MARWDSQYDFPLVQSGDVVLSVLPHERPSGMTGFVMNTRRPVFADWRVREAMISGLQLRVHQRGDDRRRRSRASPRISSNSPLGMTPGPAEGRVQEFLAPFADDLLPGTMEGYTLPVSDGSERNRAGIARALDLLAEAGWTVQDGVLKDAGGTAFTFDILLQSGGSENEAIIDMYPARAGAAGHRADGDIGR